MNPVIIQNTFAKIAPQKEAFVDTFYNTLFERYPGVKPLFQNVDWDTQKSMLVGALATVVKNAHAPESIVETLKKMGERHVKYGAKPEHYPAVGECLLYALQKFLGDDWNAEVEQNWTEAYQLVSGTMIEGMRGAAA